jgi:hypothetical protein
VAKKLSSFLGRLIEAVHVTCQCGKPFEMKYTHGD